MFARISERKRRSTHHASLRRKSKRTTLRKSGARQFDEIPGLYQVRISASLQSVLSCRIGINVTNYDRWIYIDKKTLINEIENRERTRAAGVRKIKEEIEAFPEENILIGSYGSDQFFMCLSEYATNVCENWKEEEKKKMMENLFRCLYREANIWITVGSDSEIVKSTRNPFVAEIELKPNAYAKFGLRLVKDARDGYVELLNTRTTFDLLFRKCVDKACQVTKLKIHNYTQTTVSSSFNRGIQYNYTYPEIKKNKPFIQNLKNWFTTNYDHLSSLIQCNESINIYRNDYNELPNQKRRYVIENPDLLISFFDSVACHGKMVNCIAWCGHRAGIIAAAYGRVCPKFILKNKPIFLGIQSIEETHLAIIWSITQPFKPLLYLHANREITSIKFCPFNPDIIAGGCSDGQIVIWDLNGKLEMKKPETLQRTEVEVLIKTSMAWMKYPPDYQNVFPCVVSKFETSHKSHITKIKWLPPEYYLDNQGEILQDKTEHMQFLTTSLTDSTMLVWDLKPTVLYFHPKTTKRSSSKADRPKSLDAEKSPFAYLNANFKPIFQLDFMEAETRAPININDFSFKMGKFCYKPFKAKSTVNCTDYERNKAYENMNVKKEFLAATELGLLYFCSWTAHAYDLGLTVNRQKLETLRCDLYHDGPIYHMQRSPFCANLVLTTGGRVFAIWDVVGENVKRPIIWRKCAIRYVMASWSLQNPASIIASREDGKIELWDFEEDSKAPLRMTKFIGDNLLSVFINNSFHHIWQNTCVATDFSGILSVYSTPSKLFVHNIKSKIRNYVQRIYNRRALLKFWINLFNKQREEIEVPVTDTTSLDEKMKKRSQFSTEIRRISIMAKKPPGNTWQEKEYKRMYKILIDRNRINLENIEKGRGPLNKLLESQSVRLRKIEGYIANKERIFAEEKHKISAVDEMTKKRKLSVHFPKELAEALKEQFYENYKVAEANANKYMQSHRYRYYFDWQAVVRDAKRRYHGEMIDSSESSEHEFHTSQKLFSILPVDIGRKSTKLLMTQIALVASISGK